jgi:hypothetical protein
MYRKNTYLHEVHQFLMGLEEVDDEKWFEVVCPRLKREKSTAEARTAIYKVAKEMGIEVATFYPIDTLLVRRVA